ncbi:MAG: hypothetical protein IPL61_31315 [Myxococcales bacterium]|nr:hypothetical protein [Myxococcales bacterium]
MKTSIRVGLAVVVVSCGRGSVPLVEPPCPIGAVPVKGIVGAPGYVEDCLLRGPMVPHGPYRYWEAWDGRGAQPAASIEYVSVFGKIDGEWVHRRSDGTLEKQGRYRFGTRVGPWHEDDEAGRRIQEWTFDDQGRVHGLDIAWRDGTLVSVWCYSHDTWVWGTGPDVPLEQARSRPCP